MSDRGEMAIVYGPQSAEDAAESRDYWMKAAEIQNARAERLLAWIKHIQNYCQTDKYAAQAAHINVTGFCNQALDGEKIPAFYRKPDPCLECENVDPDDADHCMHPDGPCVKAVCWAAKQTSQSEQPGSGDAPGPEHDTTD